MNDQHLEIRSYRSLFRFQRRIFRFGEVKLPVPGGIEVRSIGYAAGVLAGIYVLGQLPVIGAALAAVPWYLHWVVGPGLIVYAMTTYEYEGRAPHVALARLAAWACGPKWLLRLKRVHRPLDVVAPLDDVIVTPDLNSPVARPGVICGPVTVTTRYPIELQRHPRHGQTELTPTTSQRPLHRGKALEIPDGHQLIIGKT